MDLVFTLVIAKIKDTIMGQICMAWKRLYKGEIFILTPEPFSPRVAAAAVVWCLGNLVKYLTNSVAPETGGSSPYIQEPATGPYPEPTEST
jgi:hypothetical protein